MLISVSQTPKYSGVLLMLCEEPPAGDQVVLDQPFNPWGYI